MTKIFSILKLTILKFCLPTKKVAGMSIHQLSEQKKRLKVSLQKITRGGIEIPLAAQTKLSKGDMLYLIGSEDDVKTASKLLGYPDVPTEKLI